MSVCEFPSQETQTQCVTLSQMKQLAGARGIIKVSSSHQYWWLAGVVMTWK